MVERKAFLANLKLQYHVSQCGEHDCSANNNRIERLSHLMDELIRKMVERKLFLQIRSINIMYPNVENNIVVPITKRMEIIMSIQVYLLSRMNFDYKENGGKLLYRVSHYREHDCNANNKKDGDCYRYPSLPHFMDEL